jgi:type III pantothenate kinase
MSILLVDIGNTNTVLAISKNEEQIIDDNFFRVSTFPRTVDEINLLVESLFGKEQSNTIEVVACSSGVAEIEKSFKFWADKKQFIFYKLNASTSNIHTKYSNPNEIGSDRLANSIMFWKKYKKPGLVIDFGTATTFDVIDENGYYCGGLIIPGVEISLGALYKKAAGLKHIDLHIPDNVVAINTGDAIRSGVCFGYGEMIRGLIQRIKLTHLVDVVVVTGGVAPLIAPILESEVVVDETITINGLLTAYLDYQKN